MTTVYLIRHGAYENPKKILHLRLPGFPLSQLGKKQAEGAASYFAKKPIVAVYSSRLTRAYATAKKIADKHNLPVIKNRNLLDIRSPLQGKPTAFIDSINSDFYNIRYIRMGGEKLETAYKRIDQCLRAIARRHTGKSVVAVSHGDPIMVIWFMYRGLPMPKNFPFKDWYVPQAGGFKILFEKGRPIKIEKLPTLYRVKVSR